MGDLEYWLNKPYYDKIAQNKQQMAYGGNKGNPDYKFTEGPATAMSGQGLGNFQNLNTNEDRVSALKNYMAQYSPLGSNAFINPETGEADVDVNNLSGRPGNKVISTGFTDPQAYVNTQMRSFKPQKAVANITPGRNQAMQRFVTGAVY